jgi:predicted  nucleic acid-binding Zn-ribbon protein
MTQSIPPKDRDLDRQLIGLNRRIQRLEDTQVTAAELSMAFDRIYTEIDAVDEKIDAFRTEFDSFKLETNRKFDEINRKLDTLLRQSSTATTLRYINND